MNDHAASAPVAYGQVCPGLRSELHARGVLVITLDAPERLNSLNQAMKRDLIELITQAQMDDAVRVLVFTGEGRGFCAGDDISKGGYLHAPPSSVPKIEGGHMTPIGTANALRIYSQTLNLAIRNLDKLSIAAINGPAIHTGLSLALSCDFRIGSTQARLGSATLRYALLPDEGGHFLLVQQLGLPRALDFVLRKRIVGAQEALDLGLLGEVVAPDALLPTAMALAVELAEGPQVAMRMLKRSLYNAAESSFALALDDIATRTAMSDHHPDAIDGLVSFQEKRPPRFNAWLDASQSKGA